MSQAAHSPLVFLNARAGALPVVSWRRRPAADTAVAVPPIAAPAHPHIGGRLARAAAAARREGPLLLVVAVFAAGLVLLTATTQLVQDSWLTFVSGRAILHDGLFAPDTLTQLTHGTAWV